MSVWGAYYGREGLPRFVGRSWADLAKEICGDARPYGNSNSDGLLNWSIEPVKIIRGKRRYHGHTKKPKGIK